MHRWGGIPLSECILLQWFVPICASCLCFHPSELDNHRSLCSGLWSLLWLSLRLCRGNKGNSGGADSCWCLQSAGMADGFLIDFLVLSQFFITTSPSLCQRCAAEDLSFGLTPAKSSWALVNSCAWGLIYGQKSSRVQFLTAEADNGGWWMKQFVTSSLQLTFTGCWPISLKGALLGIDVRGWS